MKANKNLLALVITLAAPLAMRSQAPVIREAPPTEAPAVVVQTNAPQAAPVDISPGAAEVIRLAESGVGDEVVLAFIRNSQAIFSLTADHVVYLKDLGLSEAVISAMITHDTDIRGQTPLTAAVTNQPPPPVPAPVVTNQLTAPLVPPAPTYVEQPSYVTEPPPAEVNYYYNDLAPYGSWVVLDGYGWCWQPRTVVINRAWRPYCDGGHWVYTDCGWYWQSDYSWGWAPFHYGRWYLHNRCGWVWTPDRVWGPAWVSWRTSGDYCGWAPLPPHSYYDAHRGWRYNGVSVGISFGFGLHSDHFTFVSMNSFTDRNLRHHRVPHNEVRNVYNRTTINNNYTIVNNKVVNNGVAVDRVASATRREIRRATVREASPDNERRSTWQTSGRNNDTVVYRREPRAPSAPIRAEAQKVDSKNPVIQHPAVTAPTLASRSPRRGEGTDSNVTERRSGTWQTPQRSTSTANRPQSTASNPRVTREPESTSTPPRVSREPQSPATAPRVSREASSPSTTVQQTPSPAPRSTWQTPSRSDRSAAPQARSQQSDRQSVTVPSAPRAAVQERPSTAVQPNRSTTWETPSSRSRAQTAPNNVVQTAPAQGNPHVFYPKSAPQSQGVRGGQSAPAPSPQGSVRQAPPASSSSRWQSGTRVDSSARGNSGNSNNSGNSSKNRD